MTDVTGTFEILRRNVSVLCQTFWLANPREICWYIKLDNDFTAVLASANKDILCEFWPSEPPQLWIQTTMTNALKVIDWHPNRPPPHPQLIIISLPIMTLQWFTIPPLNIPNMQRILMTTKTMLPAPGVYSPNHLTYCWMSTLPGLTPWHPQTPIKMHQRRSQNIVSPHRKSTSILIGSHQWSRLRRRGLSSHCIHMM